MKIKDRPEYSSKPKPATLPPTAKVMKAVEIMAKGGFGSVIVVNKDDTIAGIVTERDLMTRLLAKKLDPAKTKLSDIMTTQVRAAKEDDNLLDWLRIMSNDRFRHLPVVDEDGKVVNMMSQGDFVSYTWPELFSRVKETAKASLASGYQIVLIIVAVLAYAFVVSQFG